MRRCPNVKLMWGTVYDVDPIAIRRCVDVLLTGEVKKQTVGRTLVYCWPTVYDAGPTVNQRWASVSCLLGTRTFIEFCVITTDLSV